MHAAIEADSGAVSRNIQSIQTETRLWKRSEPSSFTKRHKCVKKAKRKRKWEWKGRGWEGKRERRKENGQARKGEKKREWTGKEGRARK